MPSSLIYDRLLASAERQGASLAVLIDPDKQDAGSLDSLIEIAEAASIDLFMLGGSVMQDIDFEQFAASIKNRTNIPLVGFPGSVLQISRRLDAVLYLSLVSGRNPEYLFGRHVQVAPRIRELNLEAIPTAYLLIDSGSATAVQRVTETDPIPREAIARAADTALAAEMMGMRLIYLEGGSGARQPVPTAMVSRVASTCSVPVMVGGGLRTPRDVAERVEAGARFVVIGNAIEQRCDLTYLSELTHAAHAAKTA